MSSEIWILIFIIFYYCTTWSPSSYLWSLAVASAPTLKPQASRIRNSAFAESWKKSINLRHERKTHLFVVGSPFPSPPNWMRGHRETERRDLWAKWDENPGEICSGGKSWGGRRRATLILSKHQCMQHKLYPRLAVRSGGSRIAANRMEPTWARKRIHGD